MIPSPGSFQGASVPKPPTAPTPPSQRMPRLLLSTPGQPPAARHHEQVASTETTRDRRLASRGVVQPIVPPGTRGKPTLDMSMLSSEEGEEGEEEEEEEGGEEDPVTRKNISLARRAARRAVAKPVVPERSKPPAPTLDQLPVASDGEDSDAIEVAWDERLARPAAGTSQRDKSLALRTIHTPERNKRLSRHAKHVAARGKRIGLQAARDKRYARRTAGGATTPEPLSPSPSDEEDSDTAIPDDPELLEVLVSIPPVPSASPASMLDMPSSIPFMGGLQTGYEPPRFAKVEAEVVATQTQSIEGDLQDLRRQVSEDDSVVPSGPRTILQEVQEVDKRVSALEEQLEPGKTPIPTPQSMKLEVDGILAILKRILNRIFPEPRDLTSALSLDYQRTLDQSLSMLGMLASSLFLLPECNDSPKYFALSKSCLVLAATFTPKGHKVAPVIASHLGTLYFQRFQFSGITNDIKNAIYMHQQSVDAGPDDHTKRAMFLGWLGRSYTALFEEDQKAEDLKKAMEFNSKAWQSIQSKVGKAKEDEATREEKRHILEGKSRALQCLVEHVGGLNNTSLLNLGIHEWRTTLLGLMKHHDTHDEIKASCMRTLGFLYITRFDQLGGQHQTDIDKSLTFLATAITLLPEQHSDLRSTLCILAHSLVARPSSSESESEANSELAFEYLELAKELTPVSHAFEPHLRASYGDVHMALSRRATVPQIKADHLGRAIDYHQAVLGYSACHPGSRLWAKTRQRLGLCRFYKYNDSKGSASPEVEELRLSLREFISIVLAPRGHLFDRFTAACSWAKYAASHPAFWQQALCGYESAMELIPLLACFGAVPDQRRKATQKCAELATEAAAVAIEAGQYWFALTLLEQGRSVKWNHLLQLQTPLQTLKTKVGGETLAKKLDDLLKRLQLEETPASHDSTEQSSHNDLDLEQCYEEILEEIREIPGFAHFMRPKGTRVCRMKPFTLHQEC
ncbi:hypothetical protein FRC11_009027 [Ceratobasidium sp. 423]|nr:hypothetical protein FRC11_009027 [Ceratobasidium sp. 423]